MEKNYNGLLEGKIIVVNNFSFYNGKLDHAWNKGRMCIILYSDDEYEYVLPITHKIKELYKRDYLYINEKNFLEFYSKRNREYIIKRVDKKIRSKNYNDINGYVDLRCIYKIPIAFRDEIGKVNYQTYLKLKNDLLSYHDKNNLNDILLLSYKR